MQVNAMHTDAYWTLQDILNQMDIRTELKTKLNELKFTATEEYNNAARRVEDIEIANIKEEIKQKKQRMKHDLKRGTR